MAKVTTTDNASVLDGLNNAVKAAREDANAKREAHLSAKANLREAVQMRDKVYQMLGLTVPDESETDENDEN